MSDGGRRPCSGTVLAEGMWFLDQGHCGGRHEDHVGEQVPGRTEQLGRCNVCSPGAQGQTRASHYVLNWGQKVLLAAMYARLFGAASSDRGLKARP